MCLDSTPTLGRDQAHGNNKKRIGTSKRRIVRREVESLFGLAQQDAALKLGVSLSKLKSECRKLGIARWPSMQHTCGALLDRLCTSPPCETSKTPHSVKLAAHGITQQTTQANLPY